MTDQNADAAPEPVAAALIQGEGFAGLDSALLVTKPDMFDRIVAIGHQARGCETIDLVLPQPIPGLPDRVQVLVKHGADGIKIENIRPLFAAFETAPERRMGVAKVTTLQSFIALVNRHKDPNSAIFAQTVWPSPKLTAIIDYHTQAGIPSGDDISAHVARYGQHRVEYNFPITDEFQAWMAQNGKPMEQAVFAAFLEEHVDELTAPYDQERSTYQSLFKEKMAIPTEIVALSRDLEIHVGQKVKRKERLQSGERSIVFESAHTNAVGDPVEIPGIFMISVPAFVDGEPIRLPARLRYRMKGQEILWLYHLYRPEVWLRAQVQNDLLDAATATGLPSYEGAAEEIR